MLSPKSLRLNFLLKLVTAMAVLLSLFSLILYNYIRYSVESELQESLVKHAAYLTAEKGELGPMLDKQESLLKRTLKIDVRQIVTPGVRHSSPHFETTERGGRIFLRGYFPYEPEKFKSLRLELDVTQPMKTLHKVFRAIVLLNLLAMGLIILYAFFLSKMLISPIEFFSRKLSRMNENILEPLELESVPLEFHPLGRSINQLVARIKNHLLYKKELFVGTAHELKTPLAVIKTRSQVALIKREKSVESLGEALRENIETTDRMNQMVGAILQFGRAEGAQFESPVQIDLIAFLHKKIDEFQLLAHSEGKTIHFRLDPSRLEMTLQPLLLTQILQNLLQNALRYTPKGGALRIHSYLEDDHFLLKIRDEGPGVDESVDLFAPFKRSKESPGAGLGLFLVQSAIESLGGSVTLKNRKSGRGAVATVRIPLEA